MTQTTDLQTEVYLRIKQLILHFDLTPGKRVNKAALMTLLNVSSTPVRQAMLRLEQEGLLTVRPQSGSYVSLINPAIVKQAGFIRGNLSGAVMGKAIPLFDTTSLATLRNLTAQQEASLYLPDYDEYFCLEDQIQALFFQVADMQTTWDWLQVVQLQFTRLRFLRLQLVELNWHQMFVTNEDLVTAIEDGNIDAAVVLNKQKITLMEDDLELIQQMHPEYFDKG